MQASLLNIKPRVPYNEYLTAKHHLITSSIEQLNQFIMEFS